MFNYFYSINRSSKVLGSLELGQFLSKVKNTDQPIYSVRFNVEIIHLYISKIKYCERFIDYGRIKRRVVTINYVARPTNSGS